MATLRLSRLGLIGLLVLTGCSLSPSSPDSSIPHLKGIGGNIRGGQQPVSGATIQLYTVGTTEDGSAASPMLTSTVKSDANGNFLFGGLFSCANATMVYLTATGGDPGLGANNPNLSMMTAIGPCTSITANTFVMIDERTTVAAVSALAHFMGASGSPANIGSSATDVSALTAAFTLASELVDPSAGNTPGQNVPAGMTVPSTEINTLADVVASCINSAGGTAGDSTLCGQLFTLTTTGLTPTNTIQALYNLQTNSALISNTPALFNLATGIAPFQPQFSLAPPTFQVQLSPTVNPLQASPASVTFPSTAEGSTSSAQTITLTNVGSGTISLYPGAFHIIGTNAADFSLPSFIASQQLAQNQSSTIQVTTTPTASGARNAYLSINAATPLYIPLAESATPAFNGPHASLSTYMMEFLYSGVTQDLTLTNTGAQYLTIGNISTETPNFVATSNCGAGLGTDASCTISVLNRTPLPFLNNTGTNDIFDQLNIPTNDASFPQSIFLVGFGYPLTPSNVVIPAAVGSSASTTVTLKGVSFEKTPTVTGTALTGNSACTGSMQQTVCTVTVSFAPTTLGIAAGRINFHANNTEDYYVPVTGIGVTSLAGSSSTAQLSPSSLTFEDLSPQTVSPNQTVTFSNTSGAPINIQSVATTAGFSETNTCGSALAANSSCTITVSSVQPLAPATIQGALTVTDDAGTQAIPLTGIINPIIPFGTWAVGQTAFIPNPIPSYLGTVSNIQVAGDNDFNGSNCSSPPTGLSCSPPSSFTPLTTGVRSATFSMSGGSVPYSLLLMGTGAPAGPNMAFGVEPAVSSPLGSPATFSLTAYNSGTTSLNFNSCSITGANPTEFAFSSGFTCGGSHAVGSSFPLNLIFTPAQSGLRTANLVFTDTSSGQSFTVAVSGLGTFPAPTVSPASPVFPDTPIGQSSAPVSLTISRANNHPIRATVSGSPNPYTFSLNKASCAQDEVPCVLTVVFTALGSGPFTGGLTIWDVYGTASSNILFSSDVVYFSGLGGVPSASVSPASLTFALEPVFTTSSAQTITLKNSGDGPLTISSIALGGTNAAEFSMSNTCGTSVAPNGATCQISVVFSPTTPGSKSASVQITGDTAGGLPITIPITGSAQ